jgi:hypothetical protein
MDVRIITIINKRKFDERRRICCTCLQRLVKVLDMSPEVHCNLCNHCYTLGMPDPRPDIRCAQYLPKVHYNVPNGFLAPSGTSDFID